MFNSRSCALLAFPGKWENAKCQTVWSILQTMWERHWGLTKASWQRLYLCGQTLQQVAQTSCAISICLLHIPNPTGDSLGHPALADPAWVVGLERAASRGALQPQPFCDNFIRTHTQASETAALGETFIITYKNRGWQYSFPSREKVVMEV